MPKLPPPPIPPPKPTKADLLDAVNRTVPDLIVPNLRVLFVGINPGLYTAAIGYHFARPGNRFWPALFAGGFTTRLLKPWENYELLNSGYGITNMVARPTARADELSTDELRTGAKILEKKVRRFTPKFIAIVGITSYRYAFDRPPRDARPATRKNRQSLRLGSAESERSERSLPTR